MESGWDAYISTILQNNSIKKAGIYGQDGTPWSTTIQISKNEIDKLIRGIENPSKFQEKGIVIEGVKYFYLTMSDFMGAKKIIFGKKSEIFICLVLTKSALLVAISQNGATQGDFKEMIELAKSLLANNF